MDETTSPWSRGAFFICQKCGKRADGLPNQQDFAESTKNDFKARFRERGQGREVRVMVSGCLSLCPPDAQVAAWCPSDGKTELVVFDSQTEKEKIWDWLVKKSGADSKA